MARQKPSFETGELRRGLKRALDTEYPGAGRKIGAYSCGVYAFFDYDGEPIYVGQTFEGLSSRIGRHLTNQRTDAVAMSVLDPFEVCEIEMYPLLQFDGVKRSHGNFAAAKSALNQLELFVYEKCIAESAFGAILNEKDPAAVNIEITPPAPVRARIVSDEVFRTRGHPDVRIARRAQTIARLAQVISERQVNAGLRRALLTQAQRLEHLSRAQLSAWGGGAAVERKTPDFFEESGRPDGDD